MPFVKLDTGILDSTLWLDRDARECFVTALLMAIPQEFEKPIQQIEVNTLEHTDFAAPPGWYGFVPAAGVAIVRRAGIPDIERGFAALVRLGSPEAESRSPEFEGRRMIRINGGYLILNFMKYRDRDYTGAERAKRYRSRRKENSSHRDVTPSHRDTPVTSRMQSAECRVQSAEAEKNAPPEKTPTERQSAPKRASRRVPEDFQPDLAYATQQLPDIDAPREAQKFRDWEFKHARTDWPAAWRTWIGNCRENGKYARVPKGGMSVAGKPVEWQ